jgi:hypothetical protein
MCSIEEAWAGQKFAGKPVSSQADIHKAYMSLPDDITTHNNQFSMKANNEPQQIRLSRGLNSKYSREPRVQNIIRNSNDANINFSSTMPPNDNYNGLQPRPGYMEIYDKNSPMPNMSREQFSDIDNAFIVSPTLNNFMQKGMEQNSHNELLDEDTQEDIEIVTNKIINNQNKSNFSNTRIHNKYNSSNSNLEKSVSSNDTQVLFILQQVISKLDKIERDLHHQQSRNMYDIILYILIGMILSFIIYSMFSGMRK